MSILDILITRGTEPSKEEIKQALDYMKKEIKKLEREKIQNQMR